MKITIQATADEMVKVFGGFGEKAERLLELLIRNEIIEQKEGFDDPKIYEILDKVSWEVAYLAHVILEYAPESQQKDIGIYLTIDQLQEYGIPSERSASSRVGGAKRVAANVGAENILFIRTRKSDQEKRYYLASDAITTLRQFLQAEDEAYREWLDGEGLDYPGE